MATSLVAPEPPPVAIWLRTRIATAPADLNIPVHVLPHPDNRALRLAAFCDGDLVRSSSLDLEGDQAPATLYFQWVLGEPCEYQLVADILGTHDRHARDTITVIVLAKHP